MIAKKHRFYGQGGIRYINRKGSTVRGSLFTVRYVPNKRPASYRAAVVVSKKVTKSAPKRNRIRRRLYELMRTEMGAQVLGYDIVIIVFSDKLATMPPQELKAHLSEVLAQVGATS